MSSTTTTKQLDRVDFSPLLKPFADPAWWGQMLGAMWPLLLIIGVCLVIGVALQIFRPSPPTPRKRNRRRR